MANPNWPSFPGVPNMSLDGDGRPQAQDLIPGKQLGTPLNAAFINQLIDTLCRLADGQDTVIGPKLTECLQAIAAETQRAKGAEAGLQPRGPYVPSSPRDGHNDSTINNLIYDNNNGGNVAVSVQGKGLTWLQAADDYARSSDLIAEKQRAQEAEAGLQPRGPYVPSSPRDGHNDSAINNLIYDNNYGGNVAVSVVGLGMTPLQKAGDYASHADLRAETQRAQEAEAGLQPRGPYVPSSPRDDHNDSAINNLIYDNNNGGNVAVSVQGKGVTWLQAADDYALNSELTAEKQRAEAAESQFIPSLPRSGKSDITINNAAFNTATGRPWVSVVGTGVLEMLTTNDISSSLNQSGYLQLPGGLILQWGWTQNSNATFSFPLKFPNRCFIVLPGNTDAQGQYVDNAYGWPVNNSQFFLATKASNGSSSGFSCAWIAIGF